MPVFIDSTRVRERRGALGSTHQLTAHATDHRHEWCSVCGLRNAPQREKSGLGYGVLLWRTAREQRRELRASASAPRYMGPRPDPVARWDG